MKRYALPTDMENEEGKALIARFYCIAMTTTGPVFLDTKKNRSLLAIRIAAVTG